MVVVAGRSATTGARRCPGRGYLRERNDNCARHIMPQLEDITHTPLPELPPRRADSHKGDYGRALVVGGSRGMSGAVALAGRATLRSGAGLVTLAVPLVVQNVVAEFEPSYMTHGLADENGHIARAATGAVIVKASEATAVAIGPGLGRSDVLTEFVEAVYHAVHQPMVVDADALFALAQRPAVLFAPGGPRVLTPHPGEFQRLTGKPYKESERIEAAAEFARGEDDLHWAFRRKTGEHTESNVVSTEPTETVVVLKGHRTIVTDGSRVSINQTGNPGMATGGSGDVLTGVITALVCQGMSPFDAARLGVHVHGLAGDLAAAELGQVSLIASDLVEYLPRAFLALG
jgi:NAD(P)H-hydrate epimerase